VPADALADFRSCVVILGESRSEGRILARALFDSEDRPPPSRPGDLVLLHFLTASAADRRRLIDDLSARRLKLAA
jgi:hypothetical protein